MNDIQETAILAAGCFWCIEPIFQQINGVDKVISGYTGGDIKDPSYELVCSGTSGHTEAIKIWFDKKQVTYEQLLLLFFSIHDPTTLNRQGADVGTQYRSIILYHDLEQKKIAEDILKKLDSSGSWNSPIVTQIEKFDSFYSAEDYHQNYYELNPNNTYCSYVISPKVNKFKKVFSEYLKN